MAFKGTILGRRSVLGGLAVTVAAPSSVLANPLRGERSVALYCPETDERFSGVYWQNGVYMPAALRQIDWLMRDFHRDRAAEIDPLLVELLRSVAATAGTRQPVCILSAFRTPETNRQLRHEGMPAASKSQHLVARAADIAIEGVATARLHRIAVHLAGGGVGSYDSYIHVDTGPVRDWSYHHHSHHHPHRT